MTEEINLSKFDNEPWGFRLTGGRDFGTVLTVIKISQGSLAETSGMRVGDLLLGINDIPLTNLTHNEAHDVIIQAGNNFVLTIVRGSLVLPPPLLRKELPTIETNADSEQPYSGGETSDNLITATDNMAEEELMNITEVSIGQQQGLSAPPSPIPVIQVTEPPLNAAPEKILMEEDRKNEEDNHPMTEEELQDMMLGHAEIISGKAIGVDFFKMTPKSEVIERSEVLQAINDDKGNEAKKSTSKFLQEPNRPKVKPKQCDLPPAAAPYKPLIIIPKKGQPESQVQNKQNQESAEEPSGEEKHEEQTLQEEKQNEQTIQEEQKEEDQGEQTRPQEQKDQEKKEDHTDEQTQEQSNWESDLSAEEQEILQEMAAINASITLDLNAQLQGIDSPNRSPEFDRQLKKINEQLANLLCMPLDMQRYLVQVKKQIEELRRLKNPPPEPEPEPEPEPQPSEPEPSEHGSVAAKTRTPTPVTEGQSGKVSPQDEQCNSEGQENAVADTEKEDVQEVQPEPPAEPEEIGPPKNPRKNIQWQKDSHPKNRPFFPLTPKPRPVVLPEDAPIFHNNELFSEEFIAETLSGNAEVIRGRAIGVNFLKFKKNYDHLQSSGVYQMIHNEEKKSSVFPTRSGKIPSKEDCIESASTDNE